MSESSTFSEREATKIQICGKHKKDSVLRIEGDD